MRIFPSHMGAVLATALAAVPLVEAGRPAAAASGSLLPTPELIERAVSRGRIDRDRGTLYLAYALAQPDKLPASYRSDVPWDGTVPLLELQRAERTMARGPERAEIAEILSEESGPGSCGPSGSSLPNSTMTPHFYIEYGSIGGGLTVDSYTAALETSWVTEVDTFGWAPPPLWPPNPPPGNRYHIRVDALGGGVYGYVTNGGAHAGFVGNNSRTAWDDIDAYATCMVLRSDYSGFSSSPQASLDSTVAHEFNHSIQFGYGALHGANRPDAAIIEGGATWMEDEVFDSSNDNYFFLWPAFAESIGDNPSPPGYANWITFRGMTERYGTGMADGAEQVMQDFWEETSKNTGDNLTALQTALANRGATLAATYHAYAIAVKFNRECGGDYVHPYCLEEGPGYLAAEGPTSVHATISSIGGVLSRNIEDNYALNWVVLPTSGPYDVTLENNDSGGVLRGSVVCDTGTGLSILGFPSVVGPGASSTVAQFPGCASAVAVITNESQTAANPTTSVARNYQLATDSPSTNATLSVTKVGSGSGTVTSDFTINCGSVCSENLTGGTLATLAAAPAAGSVFSGWSGACTGTGACSVTLDSAKSVSANFTGLFQASVTKDGSGAGAVTSDVPGINCGQDCSETHPFGTRLVLTATPAVGSAFTGWSGAGCSGGGSCLVTMNWPKSVRATFVDAVAPTTPIVGGPALSKQFQMRSTFDVAWSAGEGSPPEAATYDVRYRGAKYKAAFGETVAWQTAMAAGSSAFIGAPGNTYCFSARASDADLNTSDYGSERCTAIPVNNTALKHRGDWAKKKGKGYFLGTFSTSSAKGASLVLPGVQAKRVAIVVTKCPGCGTIKVFLGNKLLRTIKLHASSIKKRQTVDVATFSSVRSGTLRAVVTSSGRPVKIEGVGVSRV